MKSSFLGFATLTEAEAVFEQKIGESISLSSSSSYHSDNPHRFCSSLLEIYDEKFRGITIAVTTTIRG